MHMLLPAPWRVEGRISLEGALERTSFLPFPLRTPRIPAATHLDSSDYKWVAAITHSANRYVYPRQGITNCANRMSFARRNTPAPVELELGEDGGRAASVFSEHRMHTASKRNT